MDIYVCAVRNGDWGGRATKHFLKSFQHSVLNLSYYIWCFEPHSFCQVSHLASLISCWLIWLDVVAKLYCRKFRVVYSKSSSSSTTGSKYQLHNHYWYINNSKNEMMKYCSILRSRHKNCIHVNHMEFTNYEVEDLKVGGFEYERGTWHKYVIAPSNSTTQHPLKQLKVHKYKKLYMYGCSYMATLWIVVRGLSGVRFCL